MSSNKQDPLLQKHRQQSGPHEFAQLEVTGFARRVLIRRVLTAGVFLGLGSMVKSFAARTSLCVAAPQETAGPFPADGTGGQGAEPPNVLSNAGCVRSDIRSSFAASTAVAPGVPLQVTLCLVNAGDACKPLSGCAVYLWNCNRDGEYSLYGRGIENENYLRGVQFSDSNGYVRFTTIFPACYPGRYPHLHLEVFKSDTLPLTRSSRLLTTQLRVPREACVQVYENASGYERSAAEFQNVNDRDMVFDSSSDAELAMQTLALSGDAARGYAGATGIGIHV